MLGSGVGKGGTNSTNNLAQMFLQNKATAPTGTTAPVASITQPVRPTIAPPPRIPMQRPQQGTGTPAMTPWTMLSFGGQQKPAWMTSAVQKVGMPTDGRSLEAANWRQASTKKW